MKKNNIKRRRSLIFIALCFATWAVLNLICAIWAEFSLACTIGSFIAIAGYCYYVLKQTNPFLGVFEDDNKEEE